MSDPKPAPGTIGWIDLTVDDAPGLRDFWRDRRAGPEHGSRQLRRHP